MDAKMKVTFPDGSTLNASAPMGLPGTLATAGWEAHRVRAQVVEMDMTGTQILLRRSDMFQIGRAHV